MHCDNTFNVTRHKNVNNHAFLLSASKTRPMVKQEREYLITYALTETSRQKKRKHLFRCKWHKSLAVAGLSVSNVTFVAERERSAHNRRGTRCHPDLEHACNF